MAQELRELIEKINEEGIKAAQDRAGQIEHEAKEKAKAIIQKAQDEAKEIKEKTREEIAKIEESAKSSLKQAGRDLIIALRKEISAMLDKIIVSHVQKALTPEEMVRIIAQLIKEYRPKETSDIVVLLKKEDLEKIEKTFLDELDKAVKKGINLKSSEEIHGGFAISYDSGKSYYDFTDKGLAEYLSGYIKPKLGHMLNEVTF